MAGDGTIKGPDGKRWYVEDGSIFPPFAVGVPMPKGTAVPPKASGPQAPTAEAPKPPAKPKGRAG